MNVSEAFEEFKTRLELPPTYDEIIQTRHAAVRQAVENALDGVRTQLIGSLQRKTRISPLNGLQNFDVDVLVELGTFTGMVSLGAGQGIGCDAALNAVERAIKSSLRYRRKGIEEDRPAIIVPYSDGSFVEVVPAYRDRVPGNMPPGRAYWIPRVNRWVLSDYDFDADQISKSNQGSSGRLIPCIKMLKAWARHSAPELRSYHLEVLALAILPHVITYRESRREEVAWPTLLYNFFYMAEGCLSQQAKIPGSLGEPADYYLSLFTRAALISKVQKARDACLAALGSADNRAISIWKALFGEPFPGG